MRWIIVAAAVLLGACVMDVSIARAAVLRVPSEYATIQHGIDAADVGDVVLVAPGIYQGGGNRDIQFRGRDISLVSESGPGSTTIDCQFISRAILLNTGETRETVIAGFTILNGSAIEGGGIYCKGASPTIRSCVVASCVTEGSNGGGIFAIETSMVIEDCLFLRNNTLANGGAIWIGFGDDVQVNRCSMVGNQAAYTGGGIKFYRSSECWLSECVLTGNLGGGLSLWLSDLQTLSCTLAGNRYENPTWDEGGGVAATVGSHLVAERTIVWDNCSMLNADEVVVVGSSTASFLCSVVDSSSGSLEGAITFDEYSTFAPPEFCEPIGCNLAPSEQGDVSLSPTSPCLAANSLCGQQIGAYGQGCGTVSAESASWGAIKALYR